MSGPPSARAMTWSTWSAYGSPHTWQIRCHRLRIRRRRCSSCVEVRVAPCARRRALLSRQGIGGCSGQGRRRGHPGVPHGEAGTWGTVLLFRCSRVVGGYPHFFRGLSVWPCESLTGRVGSPFLEGTCGRHGQAGETSELDNGGGCPQGISVNVLVMDMRRDGTVAVLDRAPGAVAVLTRDGSAVLVEVVEVDGVLVEAVSGVVVDLVDVVLVLGLPALD